MEFTPEELDLVNKYGKTPEGSALRERINSLADSRSKDPGNWFSYQDQIKALNDQYKQGYTKYIQDYKAGQTTPPSSGGDPNLDAYGDLLDSLKDSKQSTSQQPSAPSGENNSAKAQALRDRLAVLRERQAAQRARSTSSSRPTPAQLQQQARERAQSLGLPDQNPAQSVASRIAALRSRSAQNASDQLRVGFGR